jgi:hypothetical protein
METSTVVSLLIAGGAALYVLGRWWDDYRENKAIREYFYKIRDEQLKRYDEKIAFETKQATEAVNASRKAHEEYLVNYPDNFDGNKPRK